MTLQEFTNKYNFHDSIIEKVTFNDISKSVEMHMNFAYWMQDWYTENMPETGNLIIVFNNASQFTCPNDLPWEQISIILVSLENDSIKFALMNDITDEYIEIYIKCESIHIAQ